MLRGQHDAKEIFTESTPRPIGIERNRVDNSQGVSERQEALDLTRRTHFRTLFLSDLHLGSRACQSEPLARFLKHVQCDRLYLVGDVLDMWRLRQKWYFPNEHSKVVRRILKMSEKGTEVVLIPGNHDEAARRYNGLEFGGITIKLAAVHEAVNGERWLVCHGDRFDLVVQHSRLLAKLGAVGYETLVSIDRRVNAIRRRLGRPHLSLSQAIKHRVKHACTFISRFEEVLAEAARKDGFAGVVCGHIHKAEVRDLGGVHYYNCGDWIESCTAIAEHEDGTVELIDAKAFLARIDADREGATEDDPDPIEIEFEQEPDWHALPLTAAFARGIRDHPDDFGDA